MTEETLRPADVHRVANQLAEQVEHDAFTADPRQTGTFGYLLLDSLDDSDPGFATDLDTATLLLQHGVAFAAEDELSCSWRMALATGHAHRASTGDFSQWTPALYWGEQAVTTARTADELAESVLELAEFRVARLGTLLDDDQLPADQRQHELDTEFATVSVLGEWLADPGDHAILDLHRGGILAARYDLLDDGADLQRAIGLVDDAIGRLPAGHPAFVEGMTLLANLHRTRYLTGDDPGDLGVALALARSAADGTPHDDPARPARHLLLARIIALHTQTKETPDTDDRDRIIDSLAVAVMEDDPEVWLWYGSDLLDRGRETGNVADLETAADWLGRGAAAQAPEGEDAWLAWGSLVDAYAELFERTGDQSHADALVDAAGRALGFPVPEPDLAYELHARRLEAVLQDGSRPNLPEFLARQPFVAWLRDAHAAVDQAVAAGELSEMAAFLSLQVAMGWYHMVVHTTGQVGADLHEVRMLLAAMGPLFRNTLRLEELTPETRSLFKALAEFFDNLNRVVTGDGDADFSVLQRALADPALSGERKHLRDLLTALLPMIGVVTGSLSALDAGLALLADVRDDESAEPSDRAEAAAMHQLYEVVRAINTRTDQRRVHDLARIAGELLNALPPSPALDPVLGIVETIIRLGVHTFGTDPLPFRAPAASDVWLGKLLEPMTLGPDAVAAVRAKDAGALREIGEKLSAVTPMGEGLDAIPVHGMRAAVYDNLSLLEPGNSAALNRAIDEYRLCFSAIDMDGSPLLAEQATSLAAALRRRGRPEDLPESRRLARAVVQNAAWRVLLQSESTHAMEIARTATDAADQLTAWCVDDGVTAELVQIVDARRSLVLRSANTTRTVSARLAAIGEKQLALEWDAAGGAEEPLIPEHGGPGGGWGALRRKVLRALTNGSEDLLSPPTIEELQRALRGQGSDVLAYLLPANAHHGALAVLVPAEGEPVVRPLPSLGTADPVTRYQQAYDAWDTAPRRDGSEYQNWRAALHELCGWAWHAAAEDVLGYGRAQAPGHDPRLVLVPLGLLGLVPWHAAYRRVGDRDRHLVQDATVSYVPSGRLFCEAVARPEVSAAPALLVGNPARTLAAGAAEAVAIRDAHYPGGVFLGGTGEAPRRWVPAPDGPGTPEQVLEHLRGPLGLLHLACHAVADVRQPLASRIELAEADLSAKELLELSPTRPLQLALVVLAGCTTHVSGTDYDEALTLSTTFLAIGARTVIGSLWRVPAGWSTVALMWLFHENLRRHGLAPAEALRRAQITLLDPVSSLGELPEALLKLRLADPSGIGIESWAGFTQQGR